MLKAVDAGAVAGLSGPASVLTDVLLHLLVLVQVGRVSPVKQMSEVRHSRPGGRPYPGAARSGERQLLRAGQ